MEQRESSESRTDISTTDRSSFRRSEVPAYRLGACLDLLRLGAKGGAAEIQVSQEELDADLFFGRDDD